MAADSMAQGTYRTIPIATQEGLILFEVSPVVVLRHVL